MIQALLMLASSSDVKAEQSSAIVFGWLALIVPISLLALRIIQRGVTAEAWVERDCGKDIADVRDLALSSEIRPTLAAIVTRIHPYVDWSRLGDYLPGEPGDPEVEVERTLGYRAAIFSQHVGLLEKHYANVHRAASVYGRRVAHAKRAAIAMTAFLPLWLAGGAVLVFPDIRLPEPAAFAGIAMMGIASGWASGEWFASSRETNRLSALARALRAGSQGETR